jgi:hypothetical protein
MTISQMAEVLDSLLKQPLLMISKVKWSTEIKAALLDKSSYASELLGLLERHFAPLKSAIRSRAVYSELCEKYSLHCSTRLQAAIYDIRLITPMIAEQLLVDLEHLRHGLFSLNSTSAFKVHLQALLSRTESVLKVLMAPIEPVKAFVDLYWLNFGGEGTLPGFRRLLELMGLSKKTTEELIVEFNKHVPPPLSMI